MLVELTKKRIANVRLDACRSNKDLSKLGLINNKENNLEVGDYACLYEVR